MESSYISRDEHVAIILEAFRERYPTVKVYRAGETFSGGSAVTFRYIDGPPETEAYAFVNQFRTRGFDSMTDCAFGMDFEYNGKRCRGGYSFLSVRREYSRNFVGERAKELMAEYGLSSSMRNCQLARAS